MGGAKLAVPAGALLVVPLAPLLILLVLFSTYDKSAAICVTSGTVVIDPSAVSGITVAGYDHEQLLNAAYILQAGRDLGLSGRDQTIGVMTALGESSLRVIDYGDEAGPDSRGLFQQRDNGAWGTYEERMDPYISATNFFEALMEISDRNSLTPTEAAHRVQRSADPYHYNSFWPPAADIVAGLAEHGTIEGERTTGSCSYAAGDGPPVSPDGTYRLPQGGSGELDPSTLCQLSWAPAGTRLRCDAAVAFEDLNVAYAAAGHGNLDVSGGGAYRDIATQRQTRGGDNGWLAAVPGWSNHGWGLAVDISGLDHQGSEKYTWLWSNAGRYGWSHPSWARIGGSKPEYWHWEYVGTR
ncbi:MAG: M15 family metallopeptidase [Micrococcales bacterium]|nr:M15 family metallopeptidase [Micrococcales bacterium]